MEPNGGDNKKSDLSANIIFTKARSAFGYIFDKFPNLKTSSSRNDDLIYENPNASQKQGNSKRGILKKPTTEFTERAPSSQGLQENEIYSADRKPKSDVSQYRRKGPVPVEDLSPSERGQQSSRHGSLCSQLIRKAPLEGERGEEGMSSATKGLLTYFERLASDDNEEVDLIFVISLLRTGADINVGDDYGQTILHAIVRDWSTEAAQFAIDHGSLINKGDHFGRTPLHLAVAIDYIDMVQYLIKNGADIHSRTTKENQTALHYAAKNDAVPSMMLLLKSGAKISDRDYKDRTPLFLAAESGRSDAVRSLLEFGAPSAVYDEKGTSAVSLMVEKMPSLAYEALDQHLIRDKANRKNYYFLSYLEFNPHFKAASCPARTPLQTIVNYGELDLIMHPVIQKLITIKWREIARFSAGLDIFLNLLYAIVFTALAVTLPTSEELYKYKNLNNGGWRVVVTGFLFLLTLYFIYSESKNVRKAQESHNKWKAFRIRQVMRDIKYCHPRWPEEKRYIDEEVTRLQDLKTYYLRDAWNVFSWFTFAGFLITVVLQVIHVFVYSEQLHLTLQIAFVIGLFLFWLRLLKPCRGISYLSPLILMIGPVVSASTQFAFLFFEFYIPFVISFWILFGGEANAKKIEDAGYGSSRHFITIGDTMSSVLDLTMSVSFPIEELQSLNHEISTIIIAVYIAIGNVLCLNLYIALMSELFSRSYETATANASLQQTLILLNSERRASNVNLRFLKKFLRSECGPLEEYEYKGEKIEDKEDKEIDTAFEAAARKAELLSKQITSGEWQSSVRNPLNLKKVQRLRESVESLHKSESQIAQNLEPLFSKVHGNQQKIEEMLKKPGVTAYLKRTQETATATPVRRAKSMENIRRRKKGGK